jgi:hypothetical protein
MAATAVDLNRSSGLMSRAPARQLRTTRQKPNNCV